MRAASSTPSTIERIWIIPAILRHQLVRLWAEWLELLKARIRDLALLNDKIYVMELIA